MDKEVEKYVSGYKGPIIISKLRQLIVKDPKNAVIYLPLACQLAKANGFVGLYEELYALPKKNVALAEIKLPTYEDGMTEE